MHGEKFWWESTIHTALAAHAQAWGTPVDDPTAAGQVRELLADGFTPGQLAWQLGTSAETVRAVASGRPVRTLLIPRIQFVYETRGTHSSTNSELAKQPLTPL